MKIKTHYAFAAISFLALTSALPAQDFYWSSAGARSTAIGGVYIPDGSGVLDALSVNPAGLTTLGGRVLDLNASGIFARGSFSNSVNNHSPLDDSPGFVPAGAFGMPIGKSRFSFGVGEMPELTSVANWHSVDAPGTAGASYGLQQEKSAILAVRSVAGLGVAIGSRLSVGVSVGADYNSNTLDAPYIFQSQPVVKGLKTLLDLHTTGVGWNTSVGAVVRASRNVELQAVWKSHTVIDSTGSASGNLSAQLAALGLAVPAGFNYSARVHNVLPQSVEAGAYWRMNSRWTFALQGNWTKWQSAFKALPVALTGGTNTTVNSLLNSTSLNDTVPLQWKNQYSVHVGFERLLTENLSLRGGYVYSNNPVPSSTLSPLTAAIFQNRITTGIGYRFGRARFDLAYIFDPTATQHVGQSSLLAGEYSQSSVGIGLQGLLVGTEFRL